MLGGGTRTHACTPASLAALQGRTFNCSTGWGTEALSLPPILIPDQPQFALVKAGVRDPGPDCVAAGDAVLGYYDVDTSFRSVVGYLLVYYFILHVLTYVALLAATARRTRGGGK